jgi:hypothetical protein
MELAAPSSCLNVPLYGSSPSSSADPAVAVSQTPDSTLRLEGLTDADDDWHTLLTFDLTISGKDAETMTRTGFIAYRNHTRWQEIAAAL